MQKEDDFSQLSFEQLFEMGEQKFTQMDYDEAEYFYGLAYNKKPLDDMIVMCYAHVLKQNDKTKEAIKVLKESISKNPAGTYKRYFELAQVYDCQKSIKTFEQGIQVALQCIKNPFLNTAPQSEIKRDIAQAYASIAEICLTDLADVPFEQVEAKCAEVLEKGKQIDPTCMDVRLQIANCCIEKDLKDVALGELLLIKQAILTEKQQYEDQLVNQTAKLFMQFAEYQHSIQILQKLNESQSNNPETIYLIAYCYFLLKNYESCKEYIDEYPEGQMVDEEVEEAMKELKEELNKNYKKNGEETEEGVEGEEDEWMDVEDDQN